MEAGRGSQSITVLDQQTSEELRQGEGDGKLFFPTRRIEAERATEAYRGEVCDRAQNYNPISEISILSLK